MRYKDRVYLQQDTYNKIVKNKVGDNEFEGYISNYIKEYINYSMRDTQYEKKVNNLDVNINNGVVTATIDGQEFMRINLDENIINGQRNTESKISRMNCMIESTIDVQEAIFEADINSNAITYGLSLDEETKAQVLENNINKAYTDNSKEIFNIESGEYIDPNIAKKSVLQVYSDVIKWDKNIDENTLNKIISDFYRQYQRTDEIIEIPSKDFTVEIDGKEEKASYQDIIVSQKPEIVYKNNGLEKAYNIDGSKKELDEILSLRDSEIKTIYENERITDANKEILINQLNEAYSNVIYDAFLKDNLLDMLKRLGYDKVKQELEKLDDNNIGNLKSDGGETQKNIDYLQNNKEKIMDKLTSENSDKYEELLNKIQQDMQKQNEAIVNIDKNEISRLNEEIENLKTQVTEKGESIIEPYNEEELKQADNNRKEKREKRKEALKEKANEVKEKNSKNKKLENIDEGEKDTKKEKDSNKENSKESDVDKTNVENKSLYNDTYLKDKIEEINKKIDEVGQNGNVNKEILEELNNLNIKVSNLDVKDNDEEILKINDEISKLKSKVDAIENRDIESNLKKEISESVEKIDDNASIIDNEEVEQNKKGTLLKDDYEENVSNTGDNDKTNLDNNAKTENNMEDNKEVIGKNSVKVETKENNLDIEKKIIKDEENLIDNDNAEQILNDVESKDDHKGDISNINVNINLEDNVKDENKLRNDKENTNEDIRENADKEENIQNKDNKVEKEYEYKDVEARVESFKEYAKELSKKIMDKKLSEILSNEKLNTHQKAVEVGNLNDKRQEYYEYILDLVRKVTIRENSLAEYKENVDEKNKKIVELEEALKDIKSIEDHLKQVEQDINEEERSNNIGK